jgi:DnaJ-class molecular chaperone
MANHYKTLRVKRNATQQEIKESYYSLSKKYHPDKSMDGDAEKFKVISNAYEILGDPERRKFYDLTGSDVTDGEFNRKAGGLLQQIFQLIVSQRGLEKIQVIDMMKEIGINIGTGMKELDKNIEVARKSRATIGNVLRRVKHKSTMNPISVMLKHEIQKHTDTITKSKHEKEVGKRVTAMLTEYGYDFDQGQTMTINSRLMYGLKTMNQQVNFTGAM